MRNTKRLFITTAILFFIIGLAASSLYYKYHSKVKDNISHETAQGDTKDETKDHAKEDPKENTKENTNTEKTDTKQDNLVEQTQSNNKDEKDKPEPPKEEQQKEPSQPKEPNVEKLNISILDEIDNTKYSWWIKLNDEHKTPQIPDDIKNLINKRDGIYIGDTSEKSVYLTFDEGYENGYTPKILDVLKENDVKSIFFITSPYLEKHRDLVQRMLDEGHQVGNHTITHPSLPGLDYEKLENELLGLDKEFFKEFGMSFKYMRPPAGEYSARTLEAAKQLGYKTAFWSFAYDDWYTDKIRGADYAYNKVMNNLHNGGVYLLHAVSKDNTEALDRIIKDIKAQGYKIKAFDL